VITHHKEGAGWLHIGKFRATSCSKSNSNRTT